MNGLRRIVLGLAFFVGCGDVSEHEHEPGQLGGFIVSVGHDHYHAEIVLEQGGLLKVFMRGQDDTKVIDVEKQTVTAYVRTARDPRSTAVKLQPEPQEGDADGRTSLFVGSLPQNIAYAELAVAVPDIKINGVRYRFHFAVPVNEHAPLMPAKVENDAERELYLTSGGKYSSADIAANGNVTASEKYRGFQAKHDVHPKPGDPICPISLTKANPTCTWIINGQTYLFCCPPCIDEFVRLAKSEPDKLKPPGDYAVKTDGSKSP